MWILQCAAEVAQALKQLYSQIFPIFNGILYLHRGGRCTHSEYKEYFNVKVSEGKKDHVWKPYSHSRSCCIADLQLQESVPDF